MTIGGLLTLGWLAADYQWLGRDTIRVDDQILALRIGLRAQAEIPLHSVVHVTRPAWQDLPTPGDANAKEYRNLMNPASPNVLVHLRAPHPIAIAKIINVPVRRIGLHLDDPDGFVAIIRETQRTANVAGG